MARSSASSRKRDPNRDWAFEVVARLRDAGHQALWAGGCVRDIVLGTEPSDYDVATSARPDQVMPLFRRTVPVGLSFGVVRVLGPAGAREVEVATFRTDGRYLDGRRPESVTFGTPEEDAARRDFTINGMFLDPLKEEVLDFVGGQADLQARLVRAIGDPFERFGEDKLRLLRAVRFAARFGFAIEARTRSAIMAMADAVQVVAVERIAQELRKMLEHERRSDAIGTAFETGLMTAVVPALGGLDAEARCEALRVLEHLGERPGFPLALAALLRSLGASVVDEIGRGLKLSNEERERTVWLVEHQDALERPEELRLSRLKRLLAAPGSGDLLALGRAVALAGAGNLAGVTYCEAYRRDQPDGPLDPPALVSGADLIAAGLKPGPRFKALLESVRVMQLEGALTDREAALTWLAGEIK